MPRISVEGAATRTHPAETGTVRAHIAITSPERSAALDVAERTHARLAAAARDAVAAGGAVSWSSDHPSVWPDVEWVKPDAHLDAKQVRVFRAAAQVSVRFTDLAALSRWVSEVGLVDGVSVGGVEWDLTDATRDRLLAEVRAEAAHDAVARAASYAAALGLGDPALVGLYEAGLRPGAGAGATPGFARAFAAKAAGGGAGFELRPEELEVSVTLSADFDA